MDTIDYQIIKLLQDNGRISIKTLAEKVCLTPPAVSERVKKLEETGVITGYRAVIDPGKLGLNIKAFINITLKTGKRNEFYNFVNETKCIIECHHVTGGFSMTIKAIFREMPELEALVGKIQQYGNTQTLIILSSPIDNKGII